MKMKEMEMVKVENSHPELPFWLWGKIVGLQRDPKDERSDVSFLEWAVVSGCILAELVAFCEATRNVHLRVKEGVAWTSPTFKWVKFKFGKTQALLVSKDCCSTSWRGVSSFFPQKYPVTRIHFDVVAGIKSPPVGCSDRRAGIQSGPQSWRVAKSCRIVKLTDL